MRRTTWAVLGHWVSEGITLAEQERRALSEYPEHKRAIVDGFELGKAQLAALDLLEKQTGMAFCLDLWSFFRIGPPDYPVAG